MLEEFLNEIAELKKYKAMYKNQEVDKKVMSENLFDLMMEKYNNTSYEERCQFQKKEICSCCRYNFCDKTFDKDIGIPIKSEKNWIPSKKSCSNFEWD